ncbi:hypothetical protein QPK87_36930 [Kamptonema cortianum]|nr:hypothetical protein [Kamptonema cortianum]
MEKVAAIARTPPSGNLKAIALLPINRPRAIMGWNNLGVGLR